MKVIVDTLLLDRVDICIVVNKYPHSVITTLTNRDLIIQKFYILIHNENEIDYFYFLVDNCIAMSSKSFVKRVLNDSTFAGRIRERIVRNRILLGIEKRIHEKEE